MRKTLIATAVVTALGVAILWWCVGYFDRKVEGGGATHTTGAGDEREGISFTT